MCVSPSYVWQLRGPKWEQQPVPCKVCWQCKEHRVSDYVGRALCEASTSISTVALTLTYAPRGDLADKVLTPHHFQDFIRSLRRRGHVLRYLVAGEYGETRGRAHFHAIIFFQRYAHDVPPEWPQQKIFHIAEWPHGHVFADWNADDRALRYVCKYLLKSARKGEGWFSLSKKPALGADYFASLAQRYAELGIWPRAFEYRPPNARDKRTYFITGVSRRQFLKDLVTALGNPDPAKLSEWAVKGLEKLARYEHLHGPQLLNDDEFMAEMVEELAIRQGKAQREWERRQSEKLAERIDRYYWSPLPERTW